VVEEDLLEVEVGEETGDGAEEVPHKLVNMAETGNPSTEIKRKCNV